MKHRETIVGDTIEERAIYLWRGGADTFSIAAKLNIEEHQAERIVHAHADRNAAFHKPHNPGST
jgi:uncharacterized protein (DUF934 family)